MAEKKARAASSKSSRKVANEGIAGGARGETELSAGRDIVSDWGQLFEQGEAAVSDRLDRAIVGLLQEDGRMSYSAIGRELEISEGAVRNRVNRMIDDNVFKIIAVADPTKFGYSAYAMILMKLAPGTNPEVLAEEFGKCPEVLYVMFTAGQFDLLVEVIFETQQELSTFLVEECFERPEVRSVEPMLPLAMY